MEEEKYVGEEGLEEIPEERMAGQEPDLFEKEYVISDAQEEEGPKVTAEEPPEKAPKKKEKKTASLFEDLDRVSRTLPSLLRTQKLLKKAEKAGRFEYPEQSASKEELVERYMALCALANKEGINLEELAYSENEEFIKKMTVLEQVMGE